MENYDVTIIGGGVEAMTAAVYCSRKKLNTLLIDSPEAIGANFEDLKLIHRLKQQALEFGTIFVQSNVHSLWCKGLPKIIYTEEGPISSKSVILAMGVSPNKLGVPLESMFHGCGLHYSNSFGASYLKGRTSVIYGKNEEAVNQAIMLSALCEKVYFVYPVGHLECSDEASEVLKTTPNIVMLPQTLIASIEHQDRKVIGVKVIDKTTGNLGLIDCHLIYVSKGIEPNSKLCYPYIMTNKDGFIVTDELCKTNVVGVFATGLCCAKKINMAATDGAIAATSAIKYVESLSL